jgi:hypothetical protein
MSDTITCSGCGFVHFIRPLSKEETTLMRVRYDCSSQKTYFCNLLCCLKSEEKYHPEGYRPMFKKNIDNYYKIQQSHPEWPVVKWIDEAYNASKHHSLLSIVNLDHENKTRISNRHYFVRNDVADVNVNVDVGVQVDVDV